MTEYGRGIFLKGQESVGQTGFDWDFDVDGTGDLRTTKRESNELFKDAAFLTALALDDFEGQRIDSDLFNQVEGVVLEVLGAMNRIQRVDSVTVGRGDARNEIRIRANVIASGENQELVFTEEVTA